MQSRIFKTAIAAFAAGSAHAAAAELALNDAGYYETRGLNVLVFSNWYDSLFSDSKISGVEIIHHEERTATNGDVRLSATPGQWDPIGRLLDRTIDPERGTIEATLAYPEYDFTYVIRAEARDDGVVLSVNLDAPLPEALEGRAGFNLEFLPAAYFGKAFIADGKSGLFPRYPASDMGPVENGRAEPLPFAAGRSVTLAPEDPERRVVVRSSRGEIALYDGRNQAQNGWYVLRTLIPAGETGRVVEWTLTGSTIADWVRPPVVSYSQVGYTPAQPKVAIVELDKNDRPAKTARLLRVDADGGVETAYSGPVEPWGAYLRYNYATFDFSSVTTPGLYVIEYDGARSAPFSIDKDVYATTWRPTLDIFFPVQMDHMFVNEAYRVWHGEPHRDDALQAPVDHEHHDLYRQGPTTDTRFKPMEHIPGLNVGGWFDAGDYDIRTQSQYATVLSLVAAWEEFRIDRDTATVDWNRRYVDLHMPDGAPDILQQIKHGTLHLVAQHKAVGHAINGIVEPDLDQYTHLGDASAKTDNLVHDPRLKPGESKNGRSGVKDDRWAFTNKSSALNYGSAAALAAASRALRGYDDALAEEAFAIAARVWDEERSHPPHLFRHGNTTGGPLEIEEFNAAVELLATTQDDKYARRVAELWPAVEDRFSLVAPMALKAAPFMPEDYRAKLESAARAFKAHTDEIARANPFGTPITTGGWAGAGAVVEFAIANYVLHRAFPEIIGDEGLFRGLDYIFGRHPASNLSLVSAVGARSKEVAYGTNRADFSFIAGGVVPGVLIIKPDFPENKENWPFLWGENEYVITLAARYLYLAAAADALAHREASSAQPR
ncbi:glycoside hydrolase family 9 protein [Amphiplicatus metriothermophilus]|uniref:N-terminal ig-like domain of cellulase n=1 Tax=Amphiplicatus metriothermophilus TaxID=1519374 RepID=A0A239PWJ3_9PROT|nr:glycoside hydrolase family 9 protein [Amphiplicatus metriothermophilus]MBB5519500.1 hypothetical protein [Amphiplicatus metriothermophilus]SNT74067.1 N-terminal ig-like domain of cellulase [Amphiplicatus metriothermophilus]